MLRLPAQAEPCILRYNKGCCCLKLLFIDARMIEQ